MDIASQADLLLIKELLALVSIDLDVNLMPENGLKQLKMT